MGSESFPFFLIDPLIHAGVIENQLYKVAFSKNISLLSTEYAP
jgi:hypothetical protein